MALLLKENLSCSVCLDLLKEPVTIPCGHNYCKTCISSFWEGERRAMYRCPQCRQIFTPKPVLKKNTMLAQLVEQLKDVSESPRGSASGDVTCDICTGRKRKAIKSCLNCVTSYCVGHLQRHNEVTPSKRHRLVEPSNKLQEKICSRHDEVMKMFCLTDQQCICVLCSVEEHKDHHKVSAAAESAERQRELQKSCADIQKNVQDREEDLQLLEKQLKSIQHAADHTVQHNQQMITELIDVLHRRSSELEKDVRSKQQTEETMVRERQEKLEQEVRELKTRDAELQQISTEDHVQFVLDYSSLTPFSVSTHSPITHTPPQNHFQELTQHLHTNLMEDWTKVSGTEVRAKVLQPSEPTSRDDFLKFSHEISLDPKTVHKLLRLSKDNTKVTLMKEDQKHPDCYTRFNSSSPQVLSRENLCGRCYWEVELRGGRVSVGVAYSMIRRNGDNKCNKKSWMLECDKSNYIFHHDYGRSKVSGPGSSRIGVYVDYKAGILSFYSVRDTMTLLHRVETTFPVPLNAGICIESDDTGASAEFIKLTE